MSEDVDLLGLMKHRWTARKFKDKDIPEEDLDKILEAGRWGPSGGNSQPWELVIIRDSDVKEKVAQIYSEAMGMKNISTRYTTPPVLIAVCIDARIRDSYPENMPVDFIIYASIGSMVQNMSLMAAQLGLVISWGTQPEEAQKELKELLELTDHLEIPDILQIGYPAQDRYSSDRRPVEEFTHQDKIEEDKLREIK